MTTVVLVIHLMIAVALIGVIMLQKSEGGALGMGGGGMSGFMTGRSTANLLTRTTAVLAAAFFATSIVLALFAGGSRVAHSLVDQPLTTPAAPPATPAAPAQNAPTQNAPAQNAPAQSAPAPNAPAQTPPAAPAAPSAPLAK